MKKIYLDRNKIVALLLTIFIFSACTLDLPPEKELVKNDFWKKTEDANNALAAIYSSFREASQESFIWGELRANLVVGFPGNYGPISVSDINPIYDVIDWSKYYRTINLANTLMYYDKDILANDKSFTIKMKNGIDAEALFLRSLSYFYLLRIWKNVPLITTPSISDTCNIYPRISDESVIIKQILSDLLYAKDIANTTEFQSNPRYFKGRANKYSIMALLADVYLWNQQYQKCIDYCDSVTNSGFYSLLPSETWFTMYNPGNSNESIFEIQCMDDGTEAQVNPLFLSRAPTYSVLIDLYSGKPMLGFKTDYYSYLFPDISDLRICNGNTPLWKYMGITLNGDLIRSAVSQRDLNVIYYRYADITLMKAEALNELGRMTEAMEYMNLTFIRAIGQPYPAFLPLTTPPDLTNQSEVRTIILDERAKEFILEGKRWFDLLRAAKRNHFQNKEIITNIILQNAEARSIDVLRSKVNDTMMYYLPVPYKELLRNKNLKQNPFYER